MRETNNSVWNKIFYGPNSPIRQIIDINKFVINVSKKSKSVNTAFWMAFAGIFIYPSDLALYWLILLLFELMHILWDN